MTEIAYPEVEHDWSWGLRCRFCQIKRDYFYSNLAMLNDWPKGEKGNEEWVRKVKNLSECPTNTRVHTNTRDKP